MRKRQMTNESSSIIFSTQSYFKCSKTSTFSKIIRLFLILFSFFPLLHLPLPFLLIMVINVCCFSFFFSKITKIFPSLFFFNMRSVRRAVSAQLPCAEAPQVVLVVPMDVRPRLRLLPGSARHRTAVWPREYWPASAVLQPRVCADVAAYYPFRQKSCRNPGNCAVARLNASVGARLNVLCTWNLWGIDRSEMASRRCCLYCAIAYGREDYPSAGNSCHILCTRMDVHRYGNAYDSRDVPVTEN